MSLLTPLLAGLWWLSACDRVTPLPPPPRTRLEIRLPAMLQGPPPEHSGVSRARTRQVAVDLPEGAWYDGAVLQLPGLIGVGELRLDGRLVASVQSGPGLAEIPLAGILAPGRHVLEITARPDPGQDPLLRGADGLRTPPLVEGPRLILRPAAHVASQAVVLRGGRLWPRAELGGAPDGAQVQFVLTRDQRVVADLGRAPVVAGVAEGPAVAWDGEQWRLGDPHLLVFHAILQDAAGQVLDAAGQRVGLREVGVSEGHFVIGGQEHRLAALRSGPDRAPEVVVADAVKAGANAVEFHGAPAAHDVLAALDEVGVAAALTPRCDGVLRSTVDQSAMAEQVTALTPALLEQNRALVRSVAAHPSVLLWVVEATAVPALADLWAPVDDQARPVVGRELALTNVMVGGEQRRDRLVGTWINESAWNGPTGDATQLARAFASALDQGARGGVIEYNHGAPDRTEAWRQVLEDSGIAPARPRGARATTTLRVEGAPPTALAWLSAPWLVSEAAVVTEEGDAILRAWYDGPATLSIDGGGFEGSTTSLTLEAGRWGARGDVPDAQVVFVNRPD